MQQVRMNLLVRQALAAQVAAADAAAADEEEQGELPEEMSAADARVSKRGKIFLPTLF